MGLLGDSTEGFVRMQEFLSRLIDAHVTTRMHAKSNSG